MRLCVICEGHTEAEFVRSSIEPHLRSFGIYAHPSLLKTRMGWSGGGDVTIERLTKHIKNEYSCSDAITTLVDYYGFRGKTDLDVENLEKEILENIRSTLHDVDMKPIIPYVQLHEFEALLFSDISAFEWVIEGWGTEAEHALYTIKQKFKNPEKINDNPHTAPSKRLDNIFDGLYSKVEHGPVIAEEIGLEKIREECPRFDGWITKLEKLAM